jgi:hypothetical protein
VLHPALPPDRYQGPAARDVALRRADETGIGLEDGPSPEASGGRWPAVSWHLFLLLYAHRGDVVYADRIRAELSEGQDRPSAELIREQHAAAA